MAWVPCSAYLVNGERCCFGSCPFGEVSNAITLYEPMLKPRTSADLKKTLMHLMIQATIFVKHGRKATCYHGPTFRDWMDAINARSIEDRLTDEFSTMMPHLMFLYFTCATQRPGVGYCITTTSDFSREKFSSGNSVEAYLVWKLCKHAESVPSMAFNFHSSHEHEDIRNCLCKIVPLEKLSSAGCILVFTWIKGKATREVVQSIFSDNLDRSHSCKDASVVDQADGVHV